MDTKQAFTAEERKFFDGQREELISQGAKTITVLNSAGVAAMLGFSQALAGKDLFAPFKNWALASLSFFFVGAFVMSISFLFRIFMLGNYLESRHSGETVSDVPTIALLVSIFCGIAFFFVGSCCAIVGIAKTL